MMQKKNENVIILKQWFRVVLIILTIAAFGVSLFSVYKSLNPQQSDSPILYSYNYNTKMDYRVYLKNNKFFTTPYLGMNKQYIASIVDYIEVSAVYNFQSTENLDYDCNYEIVATTSGLYENADGKEIEVWSKAYPVDKPQHITGSGKTFNINKTIKLDYNAYNNIMTDFRNQFGLSVDSNVELALKVNVNGGLKGETEKSLRETNNIVLNIPLLQQTFEIKPNYVNSGGNTIYKETVSESSINVPLFVFGLCLLGLSLIIFINLFKSLIKITKKSEYVLALNKILKEYGDVIAETHNLPNLSKYDVINVKSFNDLVDVEEELHSPIVCYEVIDNFECIFLVLNDKTAYKFTLKDSDFGHITRSVID